MLPAFESSRRGLALVLVHVYTAVASTQRVLPRRSFSQHAQHVGEHAEGKLLHSIACLRCSRRLPAFAGKQKEICHDVGLVPSLLFPIAFLADLSRSAWLA